MSTIPGIISNHKAFSDYIYSNMRKIKLILSAIVILILFLFFFNILYVFFNPNLDQQYFYYLDPVKNELNQEVKTIHITSKPEKDIQTTLEELITGPVSHDLKNIFPGRGKIKNILINDDKLYINLNREFILKVNSSNERLIILSILRTIAANYKEINAIKFLFNNKEMHHLSGEFTYKNFFYLKK